MKRLFLPFFALALLVFPALSHAGESSVALDTVAVQGYDLVSYHLGDGVPVRGNGNNVAYSNGAVYLFANAENKKAFEANPAKYLPAYGGYCAFGASKGKKFVGDPLLYRLVNGKLYLNLVPKIQAMWEKDIPGHIATADDLWDSIKDKHPSEL